MLENFPFQLLQFSQRLYGDMWPSIVVMQDDAFLIGQNRTFEVNNSPAISPNTQQHLHWMQASFCDGFCTFICFFPVPISLYVDVQDPFFVACYNSITDTRFSLLLSVKECGTHVLSLEVNPSFFKWRNANELSMFILSAISSVVILGLLFY